MQIQFFSHHKNNIKCQDLAHGLSCRVLANMTSHWIWVESLLGELHIPLLGPPTVWCDNISILALAANLVCHAYTKHIELDLHFVCERVLVGR